MTDRAEREVPPVLRALRDQRRRLQLSQRAVADQLGVSGVALGSWERGNRCPSLVNACAYAAAVDAELVLLAGPGGQAPVPLAAWEAGRRRISVEKADAYARFLGLALGVVVAEREEGLA